ncbi:rRNA processing/ribosome biogenesis-domain-containing protein [Infundibulicybe gibba]|nr:rRNA processing/ribosome biogenesis-domain-containing protein [Infundibulicybe gibba]
MLGSGPFANRDMGGVTVFNSLATDSLATTHVLFILNTLTNEYFQPSSHLSKWTTRISSLLHAKDPGGRWAGLVLAHKTSSCSRNIMIEFAQNWLGVVLPMLSRNEPTPNLKAAIRLVRIIFSAATDVSEYQRQVSTPNVPKFTASLLGLVDKHPSVELKVLVLSTLTRLIPLYPSMHKASHTSLSSISLRFLSGSSPHPTNTNLLKAASKLYATLHLTGAKSAILTIPLNLDRLRSAVTVLSDLLQSSAQRLVQLPIGPLSKFGIDLLRCTNDNKILLNANPEIHAMEVAVVPDIWKYGCDLIISLAKCVKQHLTPYISRIVSIISFHLEQKPQSLMRLPFLKTLEVIFVYCIQMRGYEGDEVFRIGREIICPTVCDGDVLLKSLKVILRHLQRNPELPPAMVSISSRVLLSILLSLPQLAPGSISRDLSLHSKLLQKVQAMVIDLGAGTRGAMSESLGLIMGVINVDGGTNNYQHTTELLLHPRVPPLVRSLPHVGSLSLFHLEESQEETEAREKMGLGVYVQASPINLMGDEGEARGEQQILQQKQSSNLDSIQNQNPITPQSISQAPSAFLSKPEHTIQILQP